MINEENTVGELFLNKENNREIKPEIKPEIKTELTNENWMNSFLNSRDIVNNEIIFEGGDKKKFDDLAPQEKIDILNQLTTAQSDYTESEISIIDILRKKDMSLDDLVDMEVDERLSKINSDQEILNKKVDDLTPDEAYYNFLRLKYPEATDEKIQEDITLAKEIPTYEEDAQKKKDFLVNKLKTEQDDVLQRDNAANFEKEELAKSDFVNKTLGITEVGGWIIDDKTREDMNQDFLTVETNGRSIFLNDFLSSPEKMFQAHFFNKYGEGLMKNMEKVRDEEKNEAYLRGLNEGKNGGSNESFSTTRHIPGSEKPITKGKGDDKSEAKSVEDLY